MIEQQGRVVEVNGDRADISVGATTGCTACESGKGCGAGIFGRLWRRKQVVLTTENTIFARPGQSVIVGIPEQAFLRLVSRLYFLPLLAALAGGFAGQWIPEWIDFTWISRSAARDLGAMLGAALLCGLALWSVRFLPPPQTGDFTVKLLRLVTGLPGIECGMRIGSRPT